MATHREIIAATADLFNFVDNFVDEHSGNEAYILYCNTPYADRWHSIVGEVKQEAHVARRDQVSRSRARGRSGRNN